MWLQRNKIKSDKVTDHAFILLSNDYEMSVRSELMTKRITQTSVALFLRNKTLTVSS